MTETSTTHFRTCNLCEAICGLEITLDGGVITDIRGDKADPFSRGHVCPKAVALKDLQEDPDRLRKPVRREGDAWVEMEWADAYDYAAAGIREVQNKYGNAAVGAYLGNPNVHNTGATLFGAQLLKTLKTPNIFSATSADQLPHHLVAWKLFGHQMRIPVPDIDRCDHFVIMGANPMVSNGSIMTAPDMRHRLKAIAERGKIVVIDPKRTATAELAGQHHFITPGSDVLLLLAMLHVLFDEQLVSGGTAVDFFDTPVAALAAYFHEWTPERAAPHTGIAADDIRTLVRDFVAAKSPCLYGRMGVSVQQFGGLCQYLIMLFNLLTGRVDREGGLMWTTAAIDTPSFSSPGHFARHRSRVRDLPEFGGELPVSALAEEMLTPGEGQIKAMFCIAGNPVLSAPGGTELDRGFAGLDFMVAVDFYISETSRHADIILPPVSPLERDHYDMAFHVLAVRNTAKYCAPLLAPPADTRHDWQISLELTRRLLRDPSPEALASIDQKLKEGPRPTIDSGLRAGPWGGADAPLGGLTVAKLLEQPHGVDLGPLQPRLPEALRHEDGKIHLSADFFLADLPRVAAAFGDAKITVLRLIGRRDVRTNNSWLHNSHRMVKGKQRCTLLMHPGDANDAGICDSQTVELRSKSGSVKVGVELSDEMMRGVVSLPHGWGHGRAGVELSVASAHAGVSVNDVTDPAEIDLLSGNAVLNGVPVEVIAVG